MKNSDELDEREEQETLDRCLFEMLGRAYRKRPEVSGGGACRDGASRSVILCGVGDGECGGVFVGGARRVRRLRSRRKEMRWNRRFRKEGTPAYLWGSGDNRWDQSWA